MKFTVGDIYLYKTDGQTKHIVFIRSHDDMYLFKYAHNMSHYLVLFEEELNKVQVRSANKHEEIINKKYVI